jgi:hypothetical protein
MAIAIVLGVLGLVGAVLAARRSPSRADVDRWAADHGVELTAESRAIVAAYLRRSRRFRWAGAAIGLAVPMAWVAVRSEPLPADGLLVVLTGYLGGAAMAEATRVPPGASGAPPWPPAASRTTCPGASPWPFAAWPSWP